ncbi:ferrous iron transport protein A [Ruminococcus sp. YE71]|uniref:FeoA family protein n=1 Tax=unclassified Ruminococcus TaxID=2608920 RepID=UPI00087DFEC6|nr:MULTISPECIES: FeoA family protein [unclassified Ruminococcus]SDA26832.1 ferrous iron transport protein A [Ruminococcus sp. YE78]SFW44584.1 ferrous iron transport protein A [Ruminococcus sp. YE71]
MMPLVSANAGESYTIARIGGTAEVRKHLEDLGFAVGGTVTVISDMGGNLIVNVKETRVAVSRELAMKIMV